ncbi:hypothetical protein DICVIV_03939 [Dictyocaulus viviparus]|uniref:Uncharacterized protein n=1 Tax=Dictyocaulus viviparus TaxID=29172 RepID=A0A0D8Y1I5_DICVI|nr:hypothetical protein DICVIV_03939 [Dictyocaulus viviparus]
MQAINETAWLPLHDLRLCSTPVYDTWHAPSPLTVRRRGINRTLLVVIIMLVAFLFASTRIVSACVSTALTDCRCIHCTCAGRAIPNALVHHTTITSKPIVHSIPPPAYVFSTIPKNPFNHPAHTYDFKSSISKSPSYLTWPSVKSESASIPSTSSVENLISSFSSNDSELSNTTLQNSTEVISTRSVPLPSSPEQPADILSKMNAMSIISPNIKPQAGSLHNYWSSGSKYSYQRTPPDHKKTPLFRSRGEIFPAKIIPIPGTTKEMRFAGVSLSTAPNVDLSSEKQHRMVLHANKRFDKSRYVNMIRQQIQV